MHKILPTPPCWEKIRLISIPSCKIPKEFIGSAISPKIFDGGLLHCGSTTKLENFSLINIKILETITKS